MPKLDGDVLMLGPGEWAEPFPLAKRREMAAEAMTALANIHRVDWRAKLAYLGEPMPFEEDVTRWDRFVERAPEPGVDAARARGAREAPRLDPQGRADRPLPRRLQLAQHLLVEGRAACSR